MSLKIVAISDTHRQHRQVNIPDGDVLIHCGDITSNGELDTIYDFSNWLCDLPHKNKIVIAGNHDGCFQSAYLRDQAVGSLKNAGVIYLEDSEVIIDGIKIWGAPWQPTFYNWSFNIDRGPKIAEKWKLIPDDTNLLLTHGPPYGILDKTVKGENVGCQDLFERIMELPDLKAHCFGHIHSGYSIKTEFGIKFVNAAICTEAYKPTNAPIVFEL